MNEQSYEFYIFASYTVTAIFVITASLHSLLKARNIAKRTQKDQ